jgi:phosphoribosylamine--glycine ligase
MTKYGIPTAEYKVFTSYLHAEEYIRLKGTPIVIKADGLVAGKGVVAKTMDDAINALKMIMKEKVFGEAGNKVIIERYLKGEEASFMVLIDGKIAVPLTSSKEDDRIFDNDKGSSKGGMGAYSPAPVVTKKIQTEIMHSIIHPLMKGFARERITYRGVLYTRLMICDGRPYVLDFNCCFGDPEAQPVLVRLKSDLFNALKVTAEGKLRNTVLSWRDDASVCVMLLSKGYPNSYEKGKVIRGLEALRGKDDIVVFHAGTDVNDKGELVTSGEKVLGVTALGKDIRAAKKNAYKAIEKIHFEGMHY